MVSPWVAQGDDIMAGELGSGTDRLLCVTNISVSRDFDSVLDEPSTWGWCCPVPASQVLGDLVVLACFHKVLTYHVIVTDPVRGPELHMGARSSRAAVLAMNYYTRKATLRPVPRPKSTVVEEGFKAKGGTQAQLVSWYSSSPSSDQTRQNPTEVHIAPKAFCMPGVSHRVPEDLVTDT